MPCINGVNQGFQGTEPGEHENVYNISGVTSGCSGISNGPIYSTQAANADFGYELWSGRCIKNFKKRKSRGELLPYTPWQKYSIEGKIRGNCNYNYDLGNCQFACANNDFRELDTSWYVRQQELWSISEDLDTSYWVQQAAAKAYATGHDMLTFLAELNKTRDSFRDLLYRIANRKVPKSVGGLANAWLEGRYSWRPLIYDIEDMQAALENLKDKRKRLTEKAGTSQTWVETSSQVAHEGSTTYNEVHTRTTVSTEIGVGGVIACDYGLNTFRFNLPITAWELMPWSFIIDWIVNVGQSLEAMSFLTLSSASTAAGRRYVHIRKSTERWYVYTVDGYSGSASSFGLSEGVLKRRSPQKVSIIPKTRLRLNEFKIADLISLIISRSKIR